MRTRRFLQSRWWLLVWGVVVVAGLRAARTVRVENPASDWIPDTPSPAEEFWALTQRQFGTSEVVLVGVQARSGDVLDVTPLEDWLAAQPEVAMRFGPSTVRRLGRGLAALLGPASPLGELRRAVLSPEHGTALIYVVLRSPEAGSRVAYKRSFLTRLQTDGPGHLPPGTSLIIAGKPAADVALGRLLRQDTLRSAPLALGAMALVLFAVMRRRIVGPFVGVAAALVLVVGGLAVFGQPISTATVVTLPITVVTGLAYGIHVESAIARRLRLESAVRDLAAPLGWAFATTAVALLSYSVSPIPALRAFAWSASGGVAAGYLAAYTLVPHLTTRDADRRRRDLFARPGFRLYAWAARRPWVVAFAWTVFAVGAVAGLRRVRVEPNNYLGFFPSNHPTIQAHRKLDRIFGGSLPMFVVADVDSGEAFGQPAVRGRLRRFMRQVEGDPRVGVWFAPFVVGGAGEPMEAWFRGRDPRYTRAVLSVPLLGTPEARALLRFLDSVAVVQSDSLVRLRVTGPVAAGLPLLEALVDTQLKSLGLTLLVVAVALILAARSIVAGLLLLLPNLAAPVAVGATMGYFGIALDFGTVVVFSLALGIAVDDTLHIVHAGAHDEPGASFHCAQAMRRVVSPVTLTSLSAVVGFGILVLSPFPVTGRLGGLMAVGLATAWLADVTGTPLLMARRRLRFASRSSSGEQG